MNNKRFFITILTLIILFSVLPTAIFAANTKTNEIEKSVIKEPVSIELPKMPDSELTEKLQEEMSKYYSEAKNMGISIGIVKDGQVLFSNYGLTQKNGEKISEHSLFEIGSITKVFTGTILADLANQGKLSLNDPLEKYFDFPIAMTDNTKIKLIDLVTHTSGLPRLPSNFDDNYDPDKDYDPYKDYDIDKLVEFLKTVQPATKPGTVFLYSNVGMGTLGYVIEQVTGKSYDQVIQETICNKLDMKNTAGVLTTKQEAMRATPHLPNGKVTNEWNWDVLLAAGGIKSSTYDMTKFIAANLGQIAKDDKQLHAAFNMAQKSRWSGKDGTKDRKIGLAWIEISTNNICYFHNGKTLGYRSSMVLCPQKNAGVIILCNHTGDISDVDNFAFKLISIIESN